MKSKYEKDRETRLYNLARKYLIEGDEIKRARCYRILSAFWSRLRDNAWEYQLAKANDFDVDYDSDR